MDYSLAFPYETYCPRCKEKVMSIRGKWLPLSCKCKDKIWSDSGDKKDID